MKFRLHGGTGRFDPTWRGIIGQTYAADCRTFEGRRGGRGASWSPPSIGDTSMESTVVGRRRSSPAATRQTPNGSPLNVSSFLCSPSTGGSIFLCATAGPVRSLFRTAPRQGEGWGRRPRCAIPSSIEIFSLGGGGGLAASSFFGFSAADGGGAWEVSFDERGEGRRRRWSEG